MNISPSPVPARLIARFIKPVLLALALRCDATVKAEEWVLVYAATEEQQIASPKGDAPPRTERRSYTQTIVLAGHCLVVQDDRQKIIRDFSRRRFVVLNLADKTYDEWSLFSLADFFESELNNRNALGAAMRAAKVDQAAAQFDRFDNESSLRLDSPPNPHNAPPPVIERVKLADGIEFRHRDQTVVRFFPADTALPAGLRRRFVNYLAYSCAIHPEIRRALVATDAVPREMVFTWSNMNRRTTVTLHLTSAGPAQTDSSPLPTDATPAKHAGDPVFQAIAAIRAAERTGHRPSRPEAIAFAESAFADKRPLDGLMALLEHGLQSGEQLTDEIRRHRADFADDIPCQTYLKAFDQSSKAACEQSLAANATLDRTRLQRAYMLDLQRANHLDRLGKTREAMDCYLKVIHANPFHAGALHDLGMLLARAYEHPNAWLCWDTARRLYPDHPMLKDILQREIQLAAGYPDFF